MSRMKKINEVDALRGVFYSFFEMKDVQGKDNADDKVLISMQTAEQNLNPFYQYDEDDNHAKYAFGPSGMDNSSHMFAYSINLSGMFEHLNKYNKMKE